MAASNPIARGSLHAIGAALLFGITAPAVKHWGANVGPFATAALLYAGAALAAGARFGRRVEGVVTRRDALRVACVAVLGAAAAPAAFAWGLQHTGALATSLLLNLEAVFTVLLARWLYREPIGRRVALACTGMLLGGSLLGLRTEGSGTSSLLGLALVCAATLLWALDNALTRPLSELDSRSVVFWKSATGAAVSASAAFLAKDVWPKHLAPLALIVCGAVGYGGSLRLYLSAQRVLGAARTGSLFALGPFVGAALSFALGDRARPAVVLLATLLFALAAYLHTTETHHHRHRHEALEHEHAHTHDDGHHDHAHDPPVTGSHTHAHRHDSLEHDHPHGVDVHHRHEH